MRDFALNLFGPYPKDVHWVRINRFTGPVGIGPRTPQICTIDHEVIRSASLIAKQQKITQSVNDGRAYGRGERKKNKLSLVRATDSW